MAALLLASVAVAPVAAQRKGAALAGGNGRMYVGTYAGNILIVDEATEKVSGEIKLKTGIPRAIVLSGDRTKFVALDATLQRIEIVDIASRTSVDTFTLSEGNRYVRIRAFAVDPLNRFLVLLTNTATKLPDRWDVGDATLLQYDLKDRKVIRTIPWPQGEPREHVFIRFSPDGKLMYLFGEEAVIFDTTDFKEVETWEISRPLETGTGRLDFGAIDDVNDEPGFFTGVFSMEDPVQKRRLLGIGRVNLSARDIDFFTIGPEQRVTFTLGPDRKRGYGLLQEIGHYEFWTFDLEARRLHSRTEFRGRPRMTLRTSSNGKLLYIYNAGNTIDLYEAATYRYLRTITIDADTTTDLYVLPPSKDHSDITPH